VTIRAEDSPNPSSTSDSIASEKVLIQPLRYTVVSVGDGDTFRAKTQSGQPITVRIACTDAPETRQVFGTEASQRLKQLLPIGSAIELKIGDTDRYGRTVAEAIASGLPSVPYWMRCSGIPSSRGTSTFSAAELLESGQSCDAVGFS
jgi:endonuclease YncB( thermonuclease family)